MDSQVLIRLGVFAGAFIVLSILEVIFPDRKAMHSRLQRWPGNLLILLTGNAAGRVMGPLLPVAAALSAEQHGWGLASLDIIPPWTMIFITVVLLDLWIYLQHILFHKLPFFRDLHRMHHTDTHIDLTTATRFHPVEIVISILFKTALVWTLGLHPAGVVVFEILLNVSAMFNHSNIRLGPRVDRILRLIIVTPDFHRIHHSIMLKETNSNYGFFLTLWDRIFSSYVKEPSGDKRTFPIGVPGYSRPVIHRLDKLLLDPFYSKGIKDD